MESLSANLSQATVPHPQRRFARLLTILVCATAVYWSSAAIVRSDPELGRSLRQLFVRPPQERIALGTPLPKLLQAYSGKKLLVLLSGSCLGCSRDTLAYANRLHDALTPRGYAVVLVPENSAADLKPYTTGSKPLLRCAVVPDEKGTLHSLWRVSDLPQVAEFENDRAIWSRESGQSWRDAIQDRLMALGWKSEAVQFASALTAAEKAGLKQAAARVTEGCKVNE